MIKSPRSGKFNFFVKKNEKTYFFKEIEMGEF